MEIGQIIKELRIKNKLTQQALAKNLSIGQSTICEWEKGDYEPTASAIKQLAIFFDVSAGYLLGLEEYDGTKIEQKIPQQIHNDNRRYYLKNINKSKINIK
ncbi:MAG: helix-turn-helix domain-containing protein [Clostridia bacterium]|nr:helix-turn-helix domain-containing protein [Clostridia bacterium]